jgi:hypothetical protein
MATFSAIRRQILPNGVLHNTTNTRIGQIIKPDLASTPLGFVEYHPQKSKVVYKLICEHPIY